MAFHDDDPFYHEFSNFLSVAQAAKEGRVDETHTILSPFEDGMAYFALFTQWKPSLLNPSVCSI